MRSMQPRVSSTAEIWRRAISTAADSRLAGRVVIVIERAWMLEFPIGIAKRLQRSREGFEERLQFGKSARFRVGDRAGEPGRDVRRHQKLSVPRTEIGIMWTLWVTGVANVLMVYLNERSTPNGPDITPPPPSMK